MSEIPSESTGGTDVSSPSANSSGESVSADFAQTDEEMFTERDKRTEYNESECIIIRLNGDSASASSDSVHISGSSVTITDEGSYLISGTLNDGMIIVNAEETDKLQLIFNGVDITSSTSSPLYILEADKVFVTLASGTTNKLSNGGTFEAIDENNIDAAVFSKQDLTFNGSGSLEIDSPVGHGIVSKDDLVFTGGTYTVTASSHGIDANDSVRITDSEFDITANKDGIHSENSDDTTLGFIYISNGNFKISAEGDGISANSYMQIENGEFDIVAGGGAVNGSKQSSDSWGGAMGGFGGGMGRPGGRTADSASATDDSSTSMKGIKAGSGILINNGVFKIDSADDSLHSNTVLTVNGGTFDIASGDDALHAEDTLTITSGTIDISESYEGLEALYITVSGGDIKLKASDDGLNAAGGNDSSGTTGGRDGMFGGGAGMSAGNGSITISGGTLYINASGDGIDANGTITITGGHTTVVGPTQGDTATLDYDRSAAISGGTFIGTGASGMAQTFSASEQGVIALSVGNQSAGTQIIIADTNGNELISYSPELNFAVVIISSPDIKSGETYNVTVGSLSGEFEAN